MAQNIYDDPAFFAGYSEFPRSREGLTGTSEWPAFEAMLPAIAGKRALDLGCGFGQLSRWLAEAGAESVLGVDLSERMLAEAAVRTKDAQVTYRRADLETLTLDADRFNLVVSSMALHYVEDFDRIARRICEALAPGGDFVFSVEHPIYAARAEPEWVTAADGRRAFAIADYLREGRRITNWIADGVVKYHRTIGTMIAALHAAGFVLTAVNEWKPSDDQLAAHPEWRETELTRPMFLLMSARKPEVRGH